MKKSDHIIKLIGLTGGAGSGKSTVASVFEKLGAIVIDADKIGHRLLDEGAPCFDKILKTFGDGILNGQNAIDRQRLGDMVFSDPAKMSKLNRIVHPVMLREIRKQIGLCRTDHPGSPVVVDAALIVQWGLERNFDRLIMVDSPKKVRLIRMLDRGVPENKALQIIASQMPISRLKEKADIIIQNNGSIRQLEKRALAVWKRFMEENIPIR